MHCPQCGTTIESEETTFCTRCGQQLDLVRVAMSGKALDVRPVTPSRGGLNFGVGFMYLGLWPALLAVISSPIAIPAALLMLVVVLGAIIFGSVPVLRLFNAGDVPKEIERARRREIAFGSTLMFLATIIATTFVIVAVPDRWIPYGLISAITASMITLFLLSKTLFDGYLNLTANETVERAASPALINVTTAQLHDAAVRLAPSATRSLEDKTPASVVEETTRQLEHNLAERK